MKRPIFFCHIPKTGGTTLRTSIEGSFKPHEIIPDLYHMARNSGQYPPVGQVLHMLSSSKIEIRLLRGHYHYSLSEVLQNPIGIVVLRDPIDRSISLLKHLIAHGGKTKEFILAALNEGRFPAPDNQMTRYLGGSLRNIGGAINMIHDDLLRGTIEDPQKRLEEAKNRLRDVDILGVTDHLDMMAGPLKELGIKFSDVRLNAAVVSDLQLNEVQLETVMRHNELDIELYKSAISILGIKRSA